MHINFRYLPTLLILLGALQATPAISQEAPMRVAVAPCPPFVISENGELSGLAIFLWERVAAEMGVEYELTAYPLSQMLQDLATQRETRKADLGISCISITAERERLFDFSHSFHEGHVAIAAREESTWAAIKRILMSPAVRNVLGTVFGVAVLLGGLMFWLEHKVNDKIYSMNSRAGKTLEAFLVGLLFVTRGPINFYEFKSLPARTIAAVLAVGSTFLIAGITALLASAFTLQGMRSQIAGLPDLNPLRTAAMDYSPPSALLDANGIAHQRYTDQDQMLADLDGNKLDAVVADAAYLRYSIKQAQEQGNYELLTVLPYRFLRQNYGFAMLDESPFEEELNRALLDVIHTPEWEQEVKKYFGE